MLPVFLYVGMPVCLFVSKLCKESPWRQGGLRYDVGGCVCACVCVCVGVRVRVRPRVLQFVLPKGQACRNLPRLRHCNLALTSR